MRPTERASILGLAGRFLRPEAPLAALPKIPQEIQRENCGEEKVCGQNSGGLRKGEIQVWDRGWCGALWVLRDWAAW